MARIKTYTIDTLISDNDIVIGSDKDNFDQTKNYEISALRQYMLGGLNPEVGGNLKITTIVDNDSEETTPEGYFNNSVTPIIVLHYEIVFLILNGRTYIFRKNNATYGVGETQAIASDFTEIDITSIINANLQDLDSVLEQGNISQRNASIGELSLYDSGAFEDGYWNVYVSNDDFFIKNKEGLDLFLLRDGSISLLNSSNPYSFTLNAESLTDNRTATFQDASGTVAYLSDIPEVNIVDIVAGDNISITEDEGVFTINSVGNENPYVRSIQLRDSLTNTTYFESEDCIFEYDEVEAPINSIRFVFKELISYNLSFTDETVLGRAYFYYQDETIEFLDLTKENSLINDDYIEFSVPFSTYYYTEELVLRNLKEVSFTLSPDVVKSTSNNIAFDGSISDFCVKFLTRVDSVSSLTVVQAGESMSVFGNGSALTPYVVSLENLQQVVSTFPFTLNSSFDKHTIFINNGEVDVTINVPGGLENNFSCVFIQEGEGSVTFIETLGATLLYPSSTLQNKIKGQNYWAMIEKKTSSDSYFLMGSLLSV